jgi:putative oxidoreductase
MKNQTNIFPDQTRAADAALWILQILVALFFLGAASGKLTGDPQMVAAFERIGIGQWFRHATGLIEAAAAILLLVPRLVPVGALLLVCTMTGAVATHLLLFRDSPLLPLVLLTLNLAVFYGRRDRFARLVGAL